MMIGTGTANGQRRPLRVALLCSTRAPGLAELIERDPKHGRLYKLVVCVATDRDCVELPRLDAAGIPYLVHDIQDFYSVRHASIGDLAVRCEYDRVTRAILAPARPQLVVLCGYLYVLTLSMLNGYPDRIVNLHHGDLSRRGPDGLPRYRGLHAVRDAVLAGERETRSTAHVVTPEVDMGPALVRSPAYPVHQLVRTARALEATDILKAYAFAHREWMMRSAWGDLLSATLTLFAEERVRVDDRRALIDGRPGPIDLEATGTAPDAPQAPPLDAATVETVHPVFGA